MKKVLNKNRRDESSELVISKHQLIRGIPISLSERCFRASGQKMINYPIKSIVSIQNGDLRCSVEAPNNFLEAEQEKRFMMIGLVLSWFEDTPLLHKAKQASLSKDSIKGLSFRGELSLILKYDDQQGWTYATDIPEDIRALTSEAQMMIIEATHKKLLELELLCNPSVVKH